MFCSLQNMKEYLSLMSFSCIYLFRILFGRYRQKIVKSGEFGKKR